MRWMVVDTLYPQFIRARYAGSQLERASYEDQLRTLLSSRFGSSDFYSRQLRFAGHDAVDVIVNARPAQRQWAREHGYMRLSRMPASRSWEAAILEAQVHEWQPDVLFLLDMGALHDEPIKRLSARVGALVGQVAFPLDFRRDFGAYRLIVSSLPHFVRRFRSLRVPSELLPLAFEPSILREVPLGDRDLALTFVGSLGTAHSGGAALLSDVASRIPLKRWGPAADQVSSQLHEAYQGEAWGLDMYRVLARSRITLNRHIDVAGDFANNLRLFEATGMAACLLTDDKRNLQDLFVPGEEVVTYADADECARKASALLADEDALREIAGAGQARTLRDHTYEKRVTTLLDMVHVVPSAGRPPRRTVREHVPARLRRLPDAFTRRARAVLLDRFVSTGFRSTTIIGGQHALSAAWKSPRIAERQRPLADRRLREMYAGQPVPEFAIAATAVDVTRLDHLSLLEVGCASGYYRDALNHLAAGSVDYVGVDYSMALLRQGRRYARDAHLVAGDATCLPFADKAFDVVLSAAVIMHVPNWRQALSESFRVARSFVILHRTPLTMGQTAFLEKKAYGVRVVEVALGRQEILSAISEAGGEVSRCWELGRFTVPSVGLAIEVDTLLIRVGGQ